MAVAIAGANLHFPNLKSPKWNALALLSLPMPSASKTEAGSAVPAELRELTPAAMEALRKGMKSLFFFRDLLPSSVSFLPAQPTNKRAYQPKC